ncbi:MAG TPA: hypothetical protein VHQ65_04350 [Thermoanaerobaculia bacterium]|nr:hypothetical protein [Thermoanaerobaculia bacterium]
MSWSARETYDYLVCFAALMLAVLGLVQGVEAAIDLGVPEPITRPSMVEMRHRAGPEGGTISREEAAAEAERFAAEQRAWQRHRALERLATHVTLLLVTLPLFAFHWRRVRRRERAAS